MELYDVSLPIREGLPSWPGDPPPRVKRINSIQEGAGSNVTHLSFTAHTGTHIDAPDHFLDNGKGVDQISLDLFIGPANVTSLPPGEEITTSMLRSANIPPGTKRILLKTPNSQLWSRGVQEFQTDYMGLSQDAAVYLLNRDVKVIGVDYLSVAPYSDPHPTHHLLLKKDVLIIEGLDLSAVEPGQYTLYCLPLKIPGADGAPARVLLGKK